MAETEWGPLQLYPSSFESVLTKRDFFAGVALQGMLSSELHAQIILDSRSDKNLSILYSELSYQYADAMMKAGKNE